MRNATIRTAEAISFEVPQAYTDNISYLADVHLRSSLNVFV